MLATTAIAVPLLAIIHYVAAGVAGMVGIAAMAVVYSRLISKPYQAFRSAFKHDLIGPLLESIADDVRYEPAGDGAIMDDYHASELYSAGVDRYSTEDTVSCRIGATDLLLSEIHTEYKSEGMKDKDGRRSEQWHTIFQGLFISADFHKDFRGMTIVRTDMAERALGTLGRFFQKPIFSSLQLVQLEDPEFEKDFVVHASDQIEARYILSTSLMGRMLELKRRFASTVQFSFVRSRMFIAVETATDFFEPHQHRSLFDDECLRGYVDQLSLCLGVVEELGLNTRVWAKR